MSMEDIRFLILVMIFVVGVRVGILIERINTGDL